MTFIWNQVYTFAIKVYMYMCIENIKLDLISTLCPMIRVYFGLRA